MKVQIFCKILQGSLIALGINLNLVGLMNFKVYVIYVYFNLVIIKLVKFKRWTWKFDVLCNNAGYCDNDNNV